MSKRGAREKARLLVSRPETVFEELKKYAAQVKADRWSADEQLEKSLSEREDPLIDLGLACYGANAEVAGALYKKATAPPSTPMETRYRKGLRITCLSNQCVGVRSIRGLFGKCAGSITGSEETRRVLAEADWDEIAALIWNPYISDSLLQALYERGEPFSQFDEERWLNLVQLSQKNSRLITCEDDEHGYDYGHHDIQKAIFKLLRTAPATRPCLLVLYFLLDSLDPQFVASPDKIDDVLERWASVAVDDAKGNPDQELSTSLPLPEEFRCVIAALYGKAYRDGKSVVLGSPNAPDVALRCAFYGNALLTPREMKKGHERDGDVFRFAVLFNNEILREPALRKLLEEEYMIGNLGARYRRRCEQLHRRYHRRHRSFDPRAAAEWLRDTAADEQHPLGKFAAWALTSDTKAADLAKQVQSIKKSLEWGFFILVALISYLHWR